MDTLTSLLYLLVGLLLRLAIPIAATLLVIFFLRKLDKRWQAEAELQPVTVEKPECWKVKGCTPEQMKNCQAASSSLPCWQVNRQPNGYLNEKCLTCDVFVEAPVPTLTIEPRSL
ncbi:MAG: hypothetical protein ACM3PS_11290 [Syntrophothermus sp.]